MARGVSREHYLHLDLTFHERNVLDASHLKTGCSLIWQVLCARLESVVLFNCRDSAVLRGSVDFESSTIGDYDNISGLHFQAESLANQGFIDYIDKAYFGIDWPIPLG